MRTAIGIWLVIEAVIMMYACAIYNLDTGERIKCFLGLTIMFTMIHIGLWLIFG